MAYDFLEELEGHYVSPSEIRLKCFSLVNIFHANKKLAEEIFSEQEESIEIDDEILNDEVLAEDNLVKLHSEFLEKEVSQQLLYIAINFRTFDDKLASSMYSAEYKKHKKKCDKVDTYASYEGLNRFSIREACNKIIHADGIRPLEKKCDGLVVTNFANEEQVIYPIPHLSGEVELNGRFGEKEWNCCLYAPDFISILIDVLDYSPDSKKL